MAKKCKSCSASVDGFSMENIKFGLIGAAVAGALVTDQANKMITQNADGTPKTTGYFVENPKAKDAALLLAGAGITMLSDGNEMITGLGVGVAVFGGYNLVKSMMTPTTTAGIGYIAPAQIQGYIPPAQIAQQQQQHQQLMAQIQELKQQQQQQQQQYQQKMPINNTQGIIVRAGM